MKKYIEIPEEQEKHCFDCREPTVQEPLSVEILYEEGEEYKIGYNWKWECSECGLVNL